MQFSLLLKLGAWLSEAGGKRTTGWPHSTLSGLALALCAFTAMASGQSEVADQIRAHDANSKVFIAAVAANTPYRSLSRQGQWDIVVFEEPTVPIWVSEDFIYSEGEEATVIANRLNLRTGPSLQSRVLASVERGYRSRILAREAGFVQIYAPASLQFAINSDGRKRTESQQNSAAKKQNQLAEEAANSGNKSGWQTDLARGSLDLQKQDSEQGGAETTASEESTVTDVPVTSVADEDHSSEAQQHHLAPGDTISLRVFGEQDLSVSNLRIPQSGQVSFPLIGSYIVAGKTTDQLEAQLRQVLSQGYVRNPRLSVTIDSYRPIFVLGAAQEIGSFEYSEGMTVAKAIAEAGGAKFSARADGVSILRDGKVVHEGLEINSPLRVLSGDIISIDEEVGVGEEASSFVYLHGEVRSPGEYEFRRGLTVEKAIVLAGGFTLRASRKKISVSRIVEGEDAPVKIKKVALHMPVLPGDIIDVGASWF